MSHTAIQQYKIVLLGDAAVGKTSIALNFTKDMFNEHQESTVGALFLSKTVEVDDEVYKFDIWDTAVTHSGQERYRSLTPMYYRGANAALIVYDITNLDSFAKAHRWIEDLKDFSSTVSTVILVGNKSDKESERKVSTEVAKKYADDNNLLFIETSAKLSLNISEVFLILARSLPKNPESKISQNSLEGIKIRSNTKGSSCCA